MVACRRQWKLEQVPTLDGATRPACGWDQLPQRQWRCLGCRWRQRRPWQTTIRSKSDELRWWRRRSTANGVRRDSQSVELMTAVTTTVPEPAIEAPIRGIFHYDKKFLKKEKKTQMMINCCILLSVYIILFCHSLDS